MTIASSTPNPARNTAPSTHSQRRLPESSQRSRAANAPRITKASRTSLYAEAHASGVTSATLIVHSTAAHSPAQRDPVSRAPTACISARSTNHVASVTTRNGHDVIPNAALSTRK